MNHGARTHIPAKLNAESAGEFPHHRLDAYRVIISTRLYRRLAKTLRYKRWRVVRRHMESLVMLLVAGGDHVSDIEVLRADAGLCRLVGFRPSCPTQLKDFLYRFHQAFDGQSLTATDDARLSVQGRAVIRDEGPGLRLLEVIHAEVVRQALRFRIFNVVGVLVEHGHPLVVRISAAHPWARAIGEARQAVLAAKGGARASPAPA